MGLAGRTTPLPPPPPQWPDLLSAEGSHIVIAHTGRGLSLFSPCDNHTREGLMLAPPFLWLSNPGPKRFDSKVKSHKHVVQLGFEPSLCDFRLSPPPSNSSWTEEGGSSQSLGRCGDCSQRFSSGLLTHAFLDSPTKQSQGKVCYFLKLGTWGRRAGQVIEVLPSFLRGRLLGALFLRPSS